MFNKVVLVGNLVRDIELRYHQPTGSAFGSSAIAVTRKSTLPSGDKREETCFIDITFFGRQAEIANQYLRKGSKLLVEGRLRQEQWQDAQGQNRSKHSIVVENMEFLSPNSENSNSNYNSQGSYNANMQQNSYRANQNNGYEKPNFTQQKPNYEQQNNYGKEVVQGAKNASQKEQKPSYEPDDNDLPF